MAFDFGRVVIVYLLLCIVWGAICKGIMNNKGYDSWGWFWLGFFLGVIALIIVLIKEPVRNVPEEIVYENYLQRTSENIKMNDFKASGGWQCHWCGRTNENFVSSCGCGRTKEENEQYYRNKNKTEKENNNTDKKQSLSEEDRIKALKDYGELLKSGVITEEEFETKKKELLSQ